MGAKSLAGKDSSLIMSETSNQFTTIKAHVSRLVASQEEFIVEVVENLQNNFQCVPDVAVNLKLKVLGKPSPLKLQFSYLNNPPGNTIQVFICHDQKEPS
jgi:hypothetical protein